MMDTAQVQAKPTRTKYVPMVTALLKLMAQPAHKPQYAAGKHSRVGITKNKMQRRDKSRVAMAKQSRARNRGK